MIQLQQLHKSFRTNHVLQGIDLSFPASGIVALLGPNGSGKTTLLKSILGMVIPDEGNILFQGEAILGKYDYRKTIGYLSQIVQFPENLTGRELIDLMKQMKGGITREEELISLFNIEGELDKKMGTLSGGNKQKINITLAMMHNDALVILDEPSTGLDPLSLRKFKNFLLREKEMGKLIIVTTHIMSLAEELADDIIFIMNGKVHYEGSLTNLLVLHLEDDLEAAIANILEHKKKVRHDESHIEV